MLWNLLKFWLLTAACLSPASIFSNFFLWQAGTKQDKAEQNFPGCLWSAVSRLCLVLFTTLPLFSFSPHCSSKHPNHNAPWLCYHWAAWSTLSSPAGHPRAFGIFFVLFIWNGILAGLFSAFLITLKDTSYQSAFGSSPCPDPYW